MTTGIKWLKLTGKTCSAGHPTHEVSVTIAGLPSVPQTWCKEC